MTLEFAGEPGEAESIFATWAARAESGEALAFDEVLREHPEQAEALKRFHTDWELFAPLLGRAVPGVLRDDTGIVLAPLSGSASDHEESISPELLGRLGIHAPSSGRYRFRAVIGRGGGGVVLKVWDTKLSRPLAMKVVLGRGEERPGSTTPRVDGRTLSRFVDEARIASQLNHPGIVPVHELGADESGRAFFTMKLVKGEDLSIIFEHVRTGVEGWNQTRALSVLLRVCESLAFAHEKGVIHRDLKPANVMVGKHGEVYVMDWGLARVLGEPDKRDVRPRPAPRAHTSVVDSLRHTAGESPLLTMDGDVIGTPAYMSPEQARGELESVGPQSDVYGVGAMLYELLAGEMPFVPRGARLSPHTVLMRVLEGPPRLLVESASRAPVELVAICEKAMVRNSAHRYAGVDALAKDLRAYIEGRVVAAYETGTWAETKKWVRRNRLLAASVATVFFLAIGAGGGLARLSASALRERDLARWRAVVATAIAEFPEDADMRAMILRESPAELRDPETEARSVTAVQGQFHRVCALRGHTGPVLKAQFSPDGNRVVTASEDGTARVWNADGTDDSIVLAGHTGPVISAEWSPDGGKVLTASEDGMARVWKSDGTGTPLVLQGHGAGLTTAHWSPDGARILTASKDGTARVWNADGSGSPRLLMRPEWRRLWSVTLFRRSLALLVADWTAVITPPEESRRLGFFRGVRWAWLPTLQPSRETQSSSLSALIGDTETAWSIVDAASKAPGTIAIAEWSPDGQHIATGWGDDTALLWSVEDMTAAPELIQHGSRVTCLAWSPSGEQLAMGGERGHGSRLYVLDWTAPRKIFATDVEYYIRSLAWDSGGHRLLALCGLRADLWTPEIHATVPEASYHHTVEFAFGEGPPSATTTGTLGVSLNWASLSPDDHSVITADRDGGLMLWPGGPTGISLMGHDGAVVSGSWSPDGKRIATASEDCTARIWQPWKSRQPVNLSGGDDGLSGSSWSPDGRIALLKDSRVEVYEPDGAREPLSLEGPDATKARYAEFSPNGKHILALFDNSAVRVWSLGGVQESATIRGDHEDTAAARWSPDGGSIVTVSNGGAVRKWSDSQFQSSIPLVGVAPRVRELSWAPNSLRIALLGEDGSVALWDASGVNAPVSLPTRVELAAVSWSPDGAWLLGKSEEDLHLWELLPTSQHGPILLTRDSVPVGLNMNDSMWIPNKPHEVLLRMRGGEAFFWNPADGSQVKEFTSLVTALSISVAKANRLSGSLMATAVSPDGWVARSAMFSGVVVTAPSGSPAIRFPALGSWTGAIEWSPDGHRFVAAPSAVYVHTIDWPTLRDDLWRQIDDLLAPQERVRYLGESEVEAEAKYEHQEMERDERIRRR